jgi:hypothetical protein
MEGLKQPKPLKVEGNLSETWKKWRRNYEWYSTATGLNAKDEALQCATLLHCIGEEPAEIYATFTFEDAQKNKIEPLLKKFEDYFTPKRNLTFERHRFNSRLQQEGESFDIFITDLKTKASTCEFGELRDSLIKDRIVYGIKDDRLRERLLRMADLTLDKAIEACKACEQSKSQLAELAGNTASVLSRDLHVLRMGGTGTRGRGKPRQSGHSQQNTEIENFRSKCGNCGRSHPPNQCAAFGKTCRGCGIRNHFEAYCRKSKNTGASASGNSNAASGRGRGQFQPYRSRDVHAVQDRYDYEYEYDDQVANTMEELFINSVNSSDKCDSWHVTLPVGPKRNKINMKIDTGAQVNVIPYYVFRKIKGAPPLQKTLVKLTSYNGSDVPVRGKCKLSVEYKLHDYELEFIIANVKTEPILGADASVKLGMLKRIYSVNQDQVEQPEEIPKFVPKETSDDTILNEYPDLFEGVGCIKGVTHHVNLRDDAVPVVYPPRRVPESLQPKLKAELDRLQKHEIITSVDEPTDWVNPIVLVEKSDQSLRICLDPKELNTYIRREHYSIPTIDDISSKLAGAKYFTTPLARSGKSNWMNPVQS